MTYEEITVPSLASLSIPSGAAANPYYDGTIAVTAGLAAKQAKVASVEASGAHDGGSAFESAATHAQIQFRIVSL